MSTDETAQNNEIEELRKRVAELEQQHRDPEQIAGALTDWAAANLPEASRRSFIMAVAAAVGLSAVDVVAAAQQVDYQDYCRWTLDVDADGHALANLGSLTGTGITGGQTIESLVGPNLSVNSNNELEASGGSVASPGGPDTEIQYNNAGSFGGVSGFTYDGNALNAVPPISDTLDVRSNIRDDVNNNTLWDQASTTLGDGNQDANLQSITTDDATVNNSLSLGTDTALTSVVASGSVALSSGSATIDTGVGSGTTATFMVAFGPTTDDAQVAADIQAVSGGNYTVDVEETDTSVGNPTVEYDIIRVR